MPRRTLPLSASDREALARIRQLPRSLKQLIAGALDLAHDEGDDVALWWLAQLRRVLERRRPRVH